MGTKFHRHEYKPKPKTKYTAKSAKHYFTSLKTPIRLQGTEKLNQELYNFYHLLSPHSEEIKIRNFLTKKMKDFIAEALPKFKFESFGSSECKLYLPSSDIDILLVNEEKDVVPNKTLTHLGNLLRNNCDFIDQTYVIHIRTARVPILKCRDRFFGFEFDIIVNKVDGMKQAKYIHDKITELPFLKPLCIILKYFLKSRNLNDSKNGGLCSYAQFLLILHFVQLHPVVQQENFIDPLKNLGVILLDFFQFYGFDFPYEGVTLSFTDYMYKKQTISNAIISIEDPVNTNHDVGDNCSNMHTIKDVFQHAYKIMTIALSDRVDYEDSLLCLWMRINKNEESWRREIVERHKKMHK